MNGRITLGFVVGIFILLIGVSMVLDLVFGIALPVVRASIALLLIAWGARAIARSWTRSERRSSDREVWFADRQFAPTVGASNAARYDVVFGRGVIDLSKMPEPAEEVTITVDTVFGQSVTRRACMFG